MANQQFHAAFERYLAERITRARAITPGDKKALIEELRRELQEQGRVPLPSGPLKVDPRHPIVKAALEGRSVTMGGKVISQKTGGSLSDRMQALPVAAKIAIMLAIFILPILLIIIALSLQDEEEIPIVIEATPTATASPSPSPSPSPTLEPGITPTVTVTPTPEASPTPIIIEITPTAYAFSLTEGDAPNSNNDPASIEIAGFSYILSTGVVKNGAWQPAGAEWLAGSYLRRIVGLPYDPALANTLSTIRPGNVIKLRLRSGEVIKYKIAETLRVQRQQIEVLAEKTPSLAVILYGEASPERTVVIAAAVQEPQDFVIYSQGAPNEQNPIIINGTQTIPTPVPTNLTEIITTSLSITNTFADLTLNVGDCNEADQIGELKPTDKNEKFFFCDITVTALSDTIGTSYSQETFNITDQELIENTLDWIPPPLPAISEALGNGQLSASESRRGRIVGIIKEDSPVLVWQQAGIRVIIQLP